MIGLTVGGHAKAYRFLQTSAEGVVNDRVGPFPVVVLAEGKSKGVYAFFRTVRGRELEFTADGGVLRDRQTGSNWEPVKGIALDGPMEGHIWKQVPYMTAYDWAWKDFYPDSEIYSGAE